MRGIIREYTFEAGVRNLDREMANLARKTARKVAEGKRHAREITVDTLDKYLGPPRYSFGRAEAKDEVGIATGVAYTEAGGDILPIEVTLLEGKGNLTLTGQLGEVMQESIQAALSYTRSRAKALKIDLANFEKTDIHVHVPEGGIPKDGPSAGITVATALDLRVHPAAGAARSRHDGRDHAARPRAADRRVERKSDGRPSRRPEDDDPAEEESEGHGGDPQEDPGRFELHPGRAHG